MSAWHILGFAVTAVTLGVLSTLLFFTHVPAACGFLG